ncbi:MAG: hypothetical protein F6K22_11810 [Okeania sp. SIO2F4]|uniref:hypothetical protein n=1 Tax=Okeania sp. SIO2F4 TaxID=2607790 RepID=UPI00142A4385|nr:hypothetical protein [Okeania sp. SIO2F4]NES03469.1 hypothetical protein [Okeania sp. SIO2F4]
MSNTSQDQKYSSKKRATATAKDELLERARKAMVRLGIPSQKKLQDNIAANTEIAVGLSTISKFFNQKPILLSRFSIICNTLKLENYALGIQEGEEAEKAEEEEQKDERELEKSDDRIKYRMIGILGKEEEEKNQRRTTFQENTTVDEELIKRLKGFIEFVRNYYTGDAIVIDIIVGSIKLIIKSASQSGLEKIEELFQSGELNKKIAEHNLDITVENVSFRGTKFLGKPRIAVTIPGNYNQADINTLKSELIDTSANNIIKQIPPAQMLLLLLLFFFLAIPLIVEGIFPVIFQDTPQSENKNDLWYQLPFE